MNTNTLQLVNRLDVPEIAAYTVSGGIVAYAVRSPGYYRWGGFASDGGRAVRTRTLYRTPEEAIDAARAMISTTPAA